MRRSNKTGGKAAKARSEKTLTRRNARKTRRRGSSSPAELKAEVTRLLSELSESQAQQSATADVLKVISRSALDLPAVLDTLIASACRLCDADIGTIRYEDGPEYGLAATYGCKPGWRKHFASYSAKPDRASVFGQTILKGSTVHIPDVLEDVDYDRPQAQKLMNLRAALGVPLLRDGRVFGVVNLFRSKPRPFAPKQIELAETFADQAVIAIENVRLFEAEQLRSAELAESLAQQTATSEVLGVISATPGGLKSVFDTILINALNLCEANFGLLHLCDGKSFRPVAMHNIPPELGAWLGKDFEPAPEDTLGRMLATKQKNHIADVRTEQAYQNRSPPFVALVEGGGARTLLAVPLLKDGELIGDIAIYRQEVREFSDKHIALVESFASQAVIAIENTRLLNELRESLEQQTATSNVLEAISSSPGDLDPVFTALLENAARVSEANMGMLVLAEGDGKFRVTAMHGAPPALVEKRTREPVFTPGPLNNVSIAASTKKVQHVSDLRLDPSYIEREPAATVLADKAGARSLVVVPMLKENEVVGVFGMYRQEVRPFSEKQIELLTNFATQAVIAIENTRLLKELRESLEQQTATSQVLQVISSSPGDLQPVFRTMLENAVRICDAKFGNLFLGDETGLCIGAAHGAPEAYNEFLRQKGVFTPNTDVGVGKLVRTRRHYQVADLTAVPTLGDDLREATIKLAGARTLIGVPMLKDDEVIGAIIIYRQEVRPFTDKQIELVTNFAAQAVIAIENARLLTRIARVAGSSRRRRPRCWRSSPVHRANWHLCSRRCWKTRHASARPN